MTRVMIRSDWKKGIMCLEDRGFDLLPGAVIDQHLLRRNRVQRLQDILAGHPELIGLGIDESTALVVETNGGGLSVLGNSYVAACVPAAGEAPRRGANPPSWQ